MANKERVQLLVDALRSGEYTQTTGELERDGRNCCLGVACRVAIKNGLDVAVNILDGEVRYDGNGAQLPNSVKAWYDFEGSDPYIQVSPDDVDEENKDFARTPVYATTANDDFDLDFNKIADAFERTYINADPEE